MEENVGVGVDADGEGGAVKAGLAEGIGVSIVEHVETAVHPHLHLVMTGVVDWMWRFYMTNVNANRPIYAAIQARLTAALSPTTLVIHDHSEEHAEHVAMRGQGYTETHFDIVVVSSKFEGVNAVQRHRMVYKELQEEFSKGLHAVNIKTRTPEEHAKCQ